MYISTCYFYWEIDYAVYDYIKGNYMNNNKSSNYLHNEYI